jgi:hypothetical protein
MVPDCPTKLNPLPHAMVPIDTAELTRREHVASYNEERMAQDVNETNKILETNPFIHDINRGI